MKPIEFKGHNIVYGKDQEEYQPLPALKLPDGTVISCWELTDEEKETVIRTGKIYIQQMTFNESLQPILPIAELGDDLSLHI